MPPNTRNASDPVSMGKDIRQVDRKEGLYWDAIVVALLLLL